MNENDPFHLAHGLAPKKQKLRISNLQRKLETAEADRIKAADEVERLRREIEVAQIELIQFRVNDFEDDLIKHQWDRNFVVKKVPNGPSSLFYRERELLHEMIRSGPSPSSFEAQIVLDQILRMITTLSD